MKRGIKTPAFWLTILAVIAAQIPSLVMATPTCTVTTWVLRLVGLVGAGLASVGYSYSRGRAKAAGGGSATPAWGTTEFWVAAGVAIGAAAPAVFSSTACPHDDKVIQFVAGFVALLVIIGQQVGSAVSKGLPPGPGAVACLLPWLLAASMALSSGCSLWPTVRDNTLDCGAQAARDVWSVEMQHLREMVEAGVSYDSVVSYTTGLALRYGKEFVTCMWWRFKQQGDTFATGPARVRAQLYADRWLAEHP